MRGFRVHRTAVFRIRVRSYSTIAATIFHQSKEWDDMFNRLRSPNAQDLDTFRQFQEQFSHRVVQPLATDWLTLLKSVNTKKKADYVVNQHTIEKPYWEVAGQDGAKSVLAQYDDLCVRYLTSFVQHLSAMRLHEISQNLNQEASSSASSIVSATQELPRLPTEILQNLNNFVPSVLPVFVLQSGIAPALLEVALAAESGPHVRSLYMSHFHNHEKTLLECRIALLERLAQFADAQQDTALITQLVSDLRASQKTGKVSSEKKKRASRLTAVILNCYLSRILAGIEIKYSKGVGSSSDKSTELMTSTQTRTLRIMEAERFCEKKSQIGDADGKVSSWQPDDIIAVLDLFHEEGIALDASTIQMLFSHCLNTDRLALLIDLLPIFIRHHLGGGHGRAIDAIPEELIALLFYNLTHVRPLSRLADSIYRLLMRHGIQFSLKTRFILLEGYLNAWDHQKTLALLKDIQPELVTATRDLENYLEDEGGSQEQVPAALSKQDTNLVMRQSCQRAADLCLMHGDFEDGLFFVLDLFLLTGRPIPAALFERILSAILQHADKGSLRKMQPADAEKDSQDRNYTDSHLDAGCSGADRLIAWTASFFDRHQEQNLASLNNSVSGSKEEFLLAVLQLSKATLLPPAFLDLVTRSYTQGEKR
jgi:hypothetical protein